jgi:hypothetical protein
MSRVVRLVGLSDGSAVGLFWLILLACCGQSYLCPFVLLEQHCCFLHAARLRLLRTAFIPVGLSGQPLVWSWFDGKQACCQSNLAHVQLSLLIVGASVCLASYSLAGVAFAYL